MDLVVSGNNKRLTEMAVEIDDASGFEIKYDWHDFFKIKSVFTEMPMNPTLLSSWEQINWALLSGGAAESMVLVTKINFGSLKNTNKGTYSILISHRYQFRQAIFTMINSNGFLPPIWPSFLNQNSSKE